MTAGRDDRIGPTAHYTAYVWRRIGMPHAEPFATRTGAALFWGFRLGGEWVAAVLPRVPTMTEYLALRHRLIEHALDRLRPDRIVEIGAGLSRRGLTWAADRGVAYTEIDLPHMVASKRSILELRVPAATRERAGDRLRLLARDVLAPEFGDWLAGELDGAARPVVVAEGLLGYFDRGEREALVGRIGAAFARVGGGTLVCDLRSREGGAPVAVAARILKLAIRLATRGRGAREDFEDQDDVRRFFEGAGFRAAEPVDPSVLPDLAGVTSPARIWCAQV